MKKYLRKGRLFFISAALLLMVGGCGSPSEELSQTEMAMDHLLTVWSDHLRVYDEMYTSVLWALDHTEKYMDTGDWDDLTKARTACIASARYLSELSMTEEDLSDEEYVILAEAGVDTSFQSVEFDSLASRVSDEHDFIRNLILETLEGGVFFSKNIELLREDVSFHKECIVHWCECECLTTNYLLLMLEDKDAATAYWETLPERYPALSAGHGEWNGSGAALEENMEQCLDLIEESTLRQADSLSALKAHLYNIGQGVESDDIFVMDNTPEFLPMPDWYSPEMARYLSFIQEEDGSITYPASGDVLGGTSHGVYVEIGGVSAEEICDHVEIIQKIAHDVRKDEDTDTWDIIMADYNVRISLEDGTATVIFDGQDVTFVPAWYLTA